MQKWLLIGIFLVFVMMPVANVPIGSAGAEELTPEQQKAVEETVQKYLRERGLLEEDAAPPPPPPSSVGEPESKRLEKLGEPRDIGKKYGSTMEGSGKLIYARPFVASPKAILGGYVDFEYINKANDGRSSNFDNHRLVPFIYADVSEHVKFAAEIEIENGNDLRVEFATIDYLVTEPVNLRAGILLLPLGKFNLLHDSPLRDLTERPIVNRRIIPTTLHQPGVGFYGTFYPTRLSQLNYEIYATSGFTDAFGGEDNPNADPSEPDATFRSNITNTAGIRSARDNNTSFDNNDGKAVVGRLAFSPFLGMEVGGSGFFGSYDPDSTRPLAIWAVDWTLQRGPFEIIGESAWAYIRDNNLLTNGQPIANNQTNARRMTGYYIQLNYHFLPEFLTRLAPRHFRPEVSTFTGVVRWEDVNLGQDLPDTEIGRRGERQRVTLGLNFRPTEDTVFKLDFQYSPKDVDKFNNRIHDHGFLGSVATYF